MSPTRGFRRSTNVLLVVLLLAIAVGEWHRQSMRAGLVAERDRLFDIRQDVLALERELLLVRAEEADALVTGRPSLHRRLMDRQQGIQERLLAVIRELPTADSNEALTMALGRYRQSVAAELELLSRIGRGRDSGLLQKLKALERRLAEAVGDDAMRRRLLELQVQQREYVATLKTSQAVSLLADVDELREGLKDEKARGSELANALDDYRRQVEGVMAASLELELLRSEASLRFDRLPPIFRQIEDLLDHRLERSAAGIAGMRRLAVWQIVVCLAMALVFLGVRVRLERREARRTMAEIRQLVDGMAAFSKGAEEAELELPQSGDLGKVSESFRVMAGRIRSQMKTIDQERLRAEEAAQAKGDFLARVSHELRTPLHGILGMAELLDASPLDSEQAHLVDIVRQSGGTLLSVVNDLLDFSRLESGKLSLEPRAFELVERLEEIVATHAPMAHGKGLELVFRAPASLPSVVVGDPLRLNQILTNLIGNALKFTEAGFVEVVVHGVEPIQDDRGRLRLTVRDTGPGIPASLGEKIFEPFSQGEEFLQRKHGGSGLGLSIVRELVTLMDGSVRLSPEGPGAEFEVEVELGIVPAVQADGRLLEHLRLLVVDSHEPSLSSTVEHLEAQGASVGSRDTMDGPWPRADAVVLGYGAREQAPDLDTLVKRSEEARVPILCVLPTTSWGLALRNQLEALSHSQVPVIPIRRPAGRTRLTQALGEVLGGRRDGSSQPAGIHPTLATGEIMGLRILLVEDNPINREVVELMLRDTGCEVVVAENGLEALGVMREESVDLIFMDCQMPVMNGFEATRAIRELDDPVRSGVPIVALTASALPEERQRCLDAGMSAVVSKPAGQDALLEQLSRHLSPGLGSGDAAQAQKR